jgi:hypothetical protein
MTHRCEGPHWEPSGVTHLARFYEGDALNRQPGTRVATHPASQKRCRHLPTVTFVLSKRRATVLLACPVAQASTIRRCSSSV